VWAERWRQMRTAAMRHVSPVPFERLSRAIELSRIALISGLVFLHYGMYPNLRVSPFGGMSDNDYEVATFINSFLLFLFFSVVPLLSLISGWLFFSFDDSGEAANRALPRRIGGRFRSLYLPLLAWNSLYVAIVLAMFAMSPSHPLLAALNIDFSTAGLWEFFNAISAIDRYPVAFQFWFVRDLFLTVLVSPLLLLLLRRIPYITAAALGIVWLANYNLEIFFRPDVLFFFFVGGLVRTKRIDVGISSRATLILIALYVAVVGARTFAPQIVDDSTSVLGAMTRMMRLLGVLACWGCLLHAAGSPLGKALAGWGTLAFFLYAAHFPLLAEIKLLLWGALPEINDFWMVVHYLASVLVTITISLSAGVLLSRHAPRVFAVLNGGRALGFGSMRRASLRLEGAKPKVPVRS
jgi:succinoglycan biosynthesis protein ExoH